MLIAVEGIFLKWQLCLNRHYMQPAALDEKKDDGKAVILGALHQGVSLVEYICEICYPHHRCIACYKTDVNEHISALAYSSEIISL